MSPKHMLCLPALLLVGAAPAAAQGEGSLERQLLRRAVWVMRYLHQERHRSVAVLPWRIVDNERSFADNSGPFDLFLAQRLEVALAVANDPRQPVALAADARRTMRDIAGANPFTATGRQALLAHRFPLAWGDQSSSVDAFITGSAEVAHDRRALALRVYAFDRQDRRLIPVGPIFKASIAPDRLTEPGDSFGPLVGPRHSVELAYQSAQEAAGGERRHPAEDPAVPVRLEVHYDGRPVGVAISDGRAVLPAPRPGQKTTLILTRRGGDRYGLVVKVNGENTLGRQRLPARHCRRWLLEPDSARLSIHGWQVADMVVQPFPEELRSIALTVFREEPGAAAPPDISDEAVAEAAVAQGDFPANKPANFHALKAQLLHEDDFNDVLVRRQEAVKAGRAVRFRADPIPVLGLSLEVAER